MRYSFTQKPANISIHENGNKVVRCKEFTLHTMNHIFLKHASDVVKTVSKLLIYLSVGYCSKECRATFNLANYYKSQSLIQPYA